MAEQNPETLAHLDATISALEDDPAGLSPAAWRSVIERWLNTLGEHPEYNNLATTLGEIRSAFLEKPVDEPRVGELLQRLAERTAQAAAGAPEDLGGRFERMASLLEESARRYASPAPDEGLQSTGGPQQPSSHHGRTPPNPGRKSRPVEGR